MLQIYAVIGSALVISGIVYGYIFTRYLLENIRSSEVIIAISEALVTLAIGILYIYSVFVLKSYSENSVTNFTNTIDDIILRNETFEYVFTTTTTKPEEEHVENNEEDEFIEAMEENANQFPDNVITVSTEESIYYQEETSTNVVINKKTTPAPEVNKTEQFIKNYQNFLKEIIKQKLSSSSIFNKTLTNMKYGPPKIKSSRNIKIEPEEDSCFYDFFIENALLLYSFIHCLLTLLKNTLQCRMCIKSEVVKESKDTEDNKEDINSDVLDTSDSEKNDVSAPVGPIFVDSVNNPNSTSGPNLKLFQVKGNQSKSTTEVSKKVPENSQKYKLSVQVMFMWLLPILSLIVLYFSTKTEIGVFDDEQNILKKANFTIIPADQNFMDPVPTSVNITSEVENVVSKIYNIVNEVKEKVDKKTTHFTPMMSKVIYFSSQKPIAQKDSIECSHISTFLKVYYFLIFIIGYFVVILFAKITETTAKNTDSNKAKQQNICLLTFSMLWLPSVLDLFCRTFISQQGNSTVISDIFLALGNSNRIQTMFADHIFIKKHNKPNFVNPV